MKTRLCVAFWGLMVLANTHAVSGNWLAFWSFMALAAYAAVAGYKEKE